MTQDKLDAGETVIFGSLFALLGAFTGQAAMNNPVAGGVLGAAFGAVVFPPLEKFLSEITHAEPSSEPR